MILNLFKKLLNNILYIRLGEDSCSFYDPKTEKSKKFISASKFSNERLAVSDFVKAEQFLTESLKKFYGFGIIHPSPKVIIHQEFKTEGGLGDVEQRILRELAYSVGARDVYVWQGGKLSRDQIINEKYL